MNGAIRPSPPLQGSAGEGGVGRRPTRGCAAHPHPCPPRKGEGVEAGFTLVEVLAALVAGALLLVTIGWSFSSVARLLPADPSEERAERLTRVAPRIEALIEQAQPSEFEGRPDSLSAIVPPPLAAGPVGPLRLRLIVRNEAAGKSLFAAFEPQSPDVRWPAAAREIRLAEGYRDIRFDYLHDGGPADRVLPRLVTISFDDGRAVRRISATPRLDSDGSCRFDPVSMTCRP